MPTAQALAIEAMLDAQLALNGVLVTIASGEQSVQVELYKGQLNLSQYTDTGRRYRVGFQEFLGKTESLRWDANDPETSFEPDESFRLTEVADGVTRVYVCVSPGGDEQPSRAMDLDRVGWRIHTVLESETRT